MLNIKRIDRVPNATIYSLTETAPFFEGVRLQQLWFLGHVLHLPENEPGREFAMYVPTHGRRKPGRIFRFAHLSWPTNRSLHKLQFIKLKRCFSLSNRWWLVQIIQSSLILLPYRFTVFLSCWFCFSDFSDLLPRHVARPALSLYAIVSFSSLYFCFTVFFKFLALRLHTPGCSVL